MEKGSRLMEAVSGRGDWEGRRAGLREGCREGKCRQDQTSRVLPGHFKCEHMDGVAAKGRVSVGPGVGGLLQFRGQFQYICNMLMILHNLSVCTFSSSEKLKKISCF